MSPSTTSSPVMGPFPDPKVPAQASPAPSSTPRPPASSRARQNSIQSNVENSKARPSSSAAANKTNGDGDNTPEPASTAATLPKSGQDSKPTKEEGAPIKTELIKKETEKPESASTTTATSTSSIHNKDGKPEEADQKSESLPAPVPPPVTTKSGRASKPSTPALATFQEAAAAASRSRPSRAEGTNSRKSHKKSGPVAQQPLIQQVQAADTDASSSMQGDDEEGDIDADEPTYCYCNSVSYGEMVACDADGCEREWFHLACVGLKVAPGSKSE